MGSALKALFRSRARLRPTPLHRPAPRRVHDRRLQQWAGTVAALAALWCLGPTAHAQAETRRPNVLLIVLDTVRADRLATYGHDRPTSPALDLLARQGVVFEDVTAPALWTWPSHASLFTGSLPWQHEALRALPEQHEGVLLDLGVHRIRADLPTLAERFAAAGYHTVALAENPWLDPELGLMRGFHDARVFKNAEEMVRAAEEVLLRRRDAPLLLFINTMRAHAPYSVTALPWVANHEAALTGPHPPEWLRRYLVPVDGIGVDLTVKADGDAMTGIQRYLGGELEIPPEGFELMLDLYDGEVAVADAIAGSILRTWYQVHPQPGVVAVTSDHGEYFGEHGLIEHRGAVYDEVVRVPLVITAPGRLPAGRRIDTPVQLQDLHPTLLELAGIAKPPGSLVGVTRGVERKGPILAVSLPEPSCTKIADRPNPAWSLYREGGEALLWNSDGGVELYDLSADRGMSRDLARARGARVRTLLGRARQQFPNDTPVERLLRPLLTPDFLGTVLGGLWPAPQPRQALGICS